MPGVRMWAAVRYRQLIPSGFGSGEDDQWFFDFASADEYARTQQFEHPEFWWKVEERWGVDYGSTV
jgi:hypothetical protein